MFTRTFEQNEQNEHPNLVKKLRRLPVEVEKKISRLLLQGATFRQVARKFGVSLATIHRVAEDARKRAPEFDELRQISTLLKRNDANVFDAIRGANLLEYLNKFDVNLEELEHYLKLSERFFSDEVLGNKILEYAIRLLKLEEKGGKPYEEIVREAQTKSSEVAGLKAEKEVLEQEKKTLKQDVAKLREDRDTLNSEIKRGVATHKRLKNIGISKLNAYAQFTEEFELLGYDVNEVKEFAKLKEGLIEISIDPKKLKEYIEQKGSLNAELLNLTTKKVSLRNEISGMERDKERRLATNSALSRVHEILKTRIVYIPCKSCGRPLPLALESREHYAYRIENRLEVGIWCRFCGFPNSFHPLEIASQIG